MRFSPRPILNGKSGLRPFYKRQRNLVKWRAGPLIGPPRLGVKLTSIFSPARKMSFLQIFKALCFRGLIGKKLGSIHPIAPVSLSGLKFTWLHFHFVQVRILRCKTDVHLRLREKDVWPLASLILAFALWLLFSKKKYRKYLLRMAVFRKWPFPASTDLMQNPQGGAISKTPHRWLEKVRWLASNFQLITSQ